MKKTKKSSTFHSRLKEILSEYSVQEWTEKINVSRSVIFSKWRKDVYPNSENLIKICKITGHSPNWLLLGIGPRRVKEKEIDVELTEDEKADLQNDIYELEHQLFKEKKAHQKLQSDLETIRLIKWISDTFSTDGSASETKLENISNKDLVEKIIKPVLSYFEKNQATIFDMLFKYFNSQKGLNALGSIVSQITDNEKI